MYIDTQQTQICTSYAGCNETEKKGLSKNNKTILVEYGNQLVGRLKVLKKQDARSRLLSFIRFIFSLLNPFTYMKAIGKKLGKKLGGRLVQTYGEGLCNRTIQGIASKLLRHEASKGGTSLQKVVPSVPRCAAASVVLEGLKAALTPKLLPLLKILGMHVGGLTVPATIALVGLLKSRLVGKSSPTLEATPDDIEKLYSVDEQTGEVRDGNGQILTDRDLTDIHNTIARYNMISKLLVTKIEDLEEMVLKEWYLNNPTSLNNCSGERLQKIGKAIERLKSTNITSAKKTIRKMIRWTCDQSVQDFIKKTS